MALPTAYFDFHRVTMGGLRGVARLRVGTAERMLRMPAQGRGAQHDMSLLRGTRTVGPDLETILRTGEDPARVLLTSEMPRSVVIAIAAISAIFSVKTGVGAL